MAPDLVRISSDEIERLGPDELVEVMDRLLRAEGHRIGIPPANIETSSRIHVPDEGIDARIRDGRPGSRWIPEGLSVWQFKSGKVKPRDIQREFAKPGVQDAVRQGGTYLLVAGKDLTPQERERLKSALEKRL